jgi:ribosomal protein L2
MNLFKLGMKKKFLRGISWTLFLVLISTNTVFGTNSLTAYAQEVSANSAVTGITEESKDNLSTGESTEGSIDDVTESGAISGETSNDENSVGDDIEGNNGLSRIDSNGNEQPIMTLNDIILLGEDEDVYVGVLKDLFHDYTATIRQENKIVNVLSGEKLDPKKNIDVNISFAFPVMGDPGVVKEDTNTYIRGEDFAYIPFPEEFSLIGSVEADLMFKGVKIGTVKLVNIDDAGVTKQVARVDFLDTINDQSINTASANFSMTLKYDGENDSEAEMNEEVTIYDKTFTITIPPKVTTITTEKTGIADVSNRKITWKVKVTADKEGGVTEDGNLKGYTFSDNLVNVGAYTGNFKITTDADGINSIGLVSPNYANDLLTYTFPTENDVIGTVYVFFDTEIPSNKYYSNGTTTIDNTAEIYKDSLKVSSNVGHASYTMDWIYKKGEPIGTGMSGDTYDPTDRQIEWTIYINGAMSNAKLEDLLPDGLSYVSSTVYKYNNITEKYDIDETVAPINNPNGSRQELTFSLGNISGKYEVTIITKVNDTEINGQKQVTYTNNATIKGDEKPEGITSKDIGVTIGVPSITKTAGTYNNQNHKMNWNVEVNTLKQALGGDLRVLDLLVYGGNINIDDIDGIDSGIGVPGDLRYVTKDVLQGLTFQRYQMIDQASLPSVTVPGLAFTVHSLTISGKKVADLLVVTADDYKGINHENSYSFSYSTIVTNPNYYASNENNTIYNTAHLFAADKKLNDSTDKKNISSNMLKKDTLSRDDADVVTAGNVNDSSVIAAVSKDSGGALGSYDYVDKSVIYRIYVNPYNIDITDGITTDIDEVMGDYKIKDTLPEGWEFKKIKGNDYFLLYEGNGNGTKVNATGYVSDYSSIMQVSGPNASADVMEGQEMTFNFTDLKKGYVILLKAGPTEATAKGYLSQIKDYTERNNVKLIDNTKITVGVNSYTDVIVENSIVTKGVNKDYVNQDYLIWTIDYRPYDISYAGAYIKDILNQGIDLRVSSDGELLINDTSTGKKNIQIFELKLNKDGSYTKDTDLTLPDKDILTYDNALRTLYFYPPNPEQSYRLIYYTDITGDGTNINNTVQFVTSEIAPVSKLSSFSLASFASGALYQRNGWFEIKKTDGNTNSNIQGVKFTLYSSSGVVIREETTNSNGVLSMKALPDGDYTLKETTVPSGYTPSEKVYAVHVEKDGTGTPITSIDGIVTNNISIKNYKDGTTGNLLISKAVAGSGADLSKKFEFTLTLKDKNGIELTSEYPYNSFDKDNKIVKGGMIKSGDSFELSNSESFKVLNLPMESTYKVTETDYSSEGYVSMSLGSAEGNVEVDKTKTVSFSNIKNVGGLIVQKIVSGSGADLSKEFNFKIEFNAFGSYSYIGLGGIPDGTISDGDTIKLKHGQSISISGLPENTTYQVTEGDYSSDGYITTKLGDTGTIENTKTSAAIFRNARNVGELVIQKTVEGNAGDKTKKFEFIVNFHDANGSYSYSGNGVPDGTIVSGEKIELSDGQSITIHGLPEGAKYSVIEKDYSEDGYVTTKSANIGLIKDGVTNTASFINTKNVGSLSISKTVDGNAGDKSKEFEFTVTFSDNRTYSYKATGVSDGTIKSGDIIKLADGQSIEITGILEGTAYTVKEEDYSSEGYVTKSTGETGTISKDIASIAHFTNTKNNGNLAISKSVEGNRGDKNKKFEFTVTFNTNKTYSYTGTGVDDGTITSGDVIELANGQSIEITGILEGTVYAVEEKDYSSEGYVKRSVGETGTISKDTASVAHFINTYNVESNGSSSKDPDDTSSYKSKLIPKYRMGEVPSPNGKDAPGKIILVDKDGNILGTYTRVQNADGTYSYVDENGVALSASSIAKTGDNMPLIPIIVVTLIAVVGVVVLFLYKRKIFGYYYDS